MGAKSSIEWTSASWNPVRGCSMAKGSEAGGCLNCYAARMSARNLDNLKSPTTGKPFARILDSGPRWTGDVELIEKALTIPLHWKKGRRIFVNSMSDLFHESLPDEAIDRVFAVMAMCPQHQFQVLTKRPERMLRWATRTRGNHCVEALDIGTGRVRSGSWIDPIENVWLGVSVEDQKMADARIPALLGTPAAMRFVSYEPALGPVDFSSYLYGQEDHGTPFSGARTVGGCIKWTPPLDWVIVGGESGPGARHFDIRWAEQVIEDCQSAAVACFVKQLGANSHDGPHGGRVPFADRKGGDWEEWPIELRVREFPEVVR